ncbi:hypothetical protein OG909_24840 [Streptomyces sp. NBC_01754]|uniref:hypothetical protein n=1 Tax=Streptomyces sp. NBC_01754 TaxID=2975930 RepID=UPI002DD85E12|nr:hypothetical protein [Streptomyces sp. NBC_01754]WSC95243.1 hypothetical protein OG909_24840 [Streptomyces sp. NBC_01754]
MDLCQLCDQHDPTGSQLCPACTTATRVRLECLPALYDGLLPFLAPSSAIGQGRSGKGGHAPLPVREDILDLRGVMVGTLEDWLSAVRQERGMRQHPARRRGVDGRLDAAVEGLLRHMPWITVSWSEAGLFAGEIRDLARDVQSIVAPAVDTVRGTRIGTCPAVHDDGGVCGAVLRLGHGETVVRCDWCSTAWPPATWAQLKAWQDEDQAAAA